MPPACRHALPGLAAIGRWGVPDAAHLTLDDPSGRALLTLAAADDGFASAGAEGTYTMRPLPVASSDVAPSLVGFETVTPALVAAVTPADDATPAAVPKTGSARRHSEAGSTLADLSGRYAVMRDKHDTGCMITLDKTRGKGGDRAQLAPGCRDQGIVVFDPLAWQIVRGDLVLTARAGHKTKLESQGEGAWAKDPKEGGKPLGLKKL